jgi:hypothetical protein
VITVNDRCELRLFEMYLKRRAEKPDEDKMQAYAEIYGEVVFEDPEGMPPGSTGR